MNVSVRCPTLVLCCLGFLSCLHSAAQQATESQDTPFKIEVNVNKVLVPVVVRDKRGRAVGDLKKENFQVFDNGKPQLVSGFTVEKRGATEDHTASDTAGGQQPATPAKAAGQSSPAPERFVVFLFDDMHLSPEDLARAKKAGSRVLAEALADSDMAAVVSTSGLTNSGLVRDRAKLQEAMMSLQPRGLYRLDDRECPNIDYYQADLIENKHNNTAMESATRQVFNCQPGLDMQRDQAEYHRSAMTLAENVMAELADGTGGTFFHNSNDLTAGFKGLAEVPEYVYVLEFSLGSMKSNGAYHRLKVKVDRDGVRSQARRGYFAPKP